jgi:ribosomal protein S12 methylthiotransferase
MSNNKNVVHEEDGNIVVINTCGFIDNAKQQSIDTILENVKKKNEGLIDKVFVTGCLSERYKPDLKKEIPDVDEYFGTTEMPSLLKHLGADYKHELIGERLLTTPKNYAYLKISEGCDRPCSFCAIPLMRGKHKSIPIEDLVKEAKILAEKGIKELILIAQDSTYYGIDLYGKRKLSKLLKELVKVEGIEWIRLHYAFPNGFPLDVLEVINSEPKICNYIDIPLQHISDKILKSMKRGASMDKINNLLQSFRNKVPGIALRTTLIVGYPGETNEDFDLLKKWVKKSKFDRLGCFTYSHEENTGAYNLIDDVPEEIKHERLNEIMEIQSQISWELNQNKIGQTFRVLVDRKRGSYYVGRTQYDSPDVDNEVLIEAKSNFLRVGQFVNAKIIEASDFDLYAEV